MGMNFEAIIFEWSWLFYVVIATILAIAPVTFAVAKRRDWI
jgi:Mg2+ and Co2+ transporter CorA